MNINDILSLTSPEAKDNFIAAVLAGAFEEGDGTFNIDKEIPGADFVEMFVDRFHVFTADFDRGIETLKAASFADYQEGVLDAAVHDIASSAASDTNNGGVDAQLRFLIRAGLDADGIASVSD